MSPPEAGLALILLPLAYIVPVFLFVVSGLHLFRGSKAFKRDLVVALLTGPGAFATLLLISSQFTGNEEAEFGGALYGFFFGVFAHIPAIIIWLTCLSDRERAFGMPEIVGLVIVAPMIAFLVSGVVTASL